MQELEDYINREATKIREVARWPIDLHQRARKKVRDRLMTLWKVDRSTIYAWCNQKYVVTEVEGRLEAFKTMTDARKGELL